MQEIFFVCLRNPCENTFFKTSNILCVCIYIYKERSKHVRVLAVCNTQENKHFSLYIFFQNANITIRRKHQNGK